MATNNFIKEIINTYGKNQYYLGFYVGFISGAMFVALFLIK